MQIYIVLLLYYLISSKYCLIIKYLKNIQMQYLCGKKLITSIRGTQREYSSKPLKHSIVKCILVFEG